MHETNVEHQQLHDAQERRIQLEAQALREAHQLEQQAAHTAQEYQDMVQALRQHADDQPDKEKLLWKRHLSQQADYRAEIHELHTELLNMREKSETKSHLAANMCRIEQTVPSRTVEAGPDMTILLTLYLQAGIQDGFYHMSLRLRIDPLHRDFNYLSVFQFNWDQAL